MGEHVFVHKMDMTAFSLTKAIMMSGMNTQKHTLTYINRGEEFRLLEIRLNLARLL